MATYRVPNKLPLVYNENTGENFVSMPNSFRQKKDFEKEKGRTRKFSKQNPEEPVQPRPLLLKIIPNNVPRMAHNTQRYERVRCAPMLIDLEPPVESEGSMSELVDIKPILQSLIFVDPKKCWGCETCDQEFPNYASLLKHVADTNCNNLFGELFVEHSSSLSTASDNLIKRRGESKLSSGMDDAKYFEKSKHSTTAYNVKNLGKLKTKPDSITVVSYGNSFAKPQYSENWMRSTKPKVSGNSLYNFCVGLNLNSGLRDLELDESN